ncbi:Cation/H+ exchanger [Gorgonomyces haynaldii]|nr:Cation/H+ exchanger [Gorgonomyces haynaldii]
MSEVDVSFGILLLISLLFTILVISYHLESKRITFIHETVVSIVLGLLVGLLVHLFDERTVGSIVTFDHSYFFNFLLPPIILHSGYDMQKEQFFKHIGTILIFALLGTFISTLVIGSILFLFQYFGLLVEMSFLDCILVGSILSSTDPVTVLAIFSQLKVDQQLYTLIFGESILNDSVAIVLFSVLGTLKGTELTVEALLRTFAAFFVNFFGSIFIGVIISLLTALMLKHTRIHTLPSTETCCVILLAYSSYLLSNSFKLSGIVSLLFCGITLKHYASENMSPTTRRTIRNMFRVLSQLSENFVFIYLGITLFTKKELEFSLVFIFLGLFLIIFARYCSVIPLSNLINWYSKQQAIPKNHQLMIVFSGLRGAIAFALSFEVEGKPAHVIQTTILVVCVVSVIVLGGLTPQMLNYLEIKQGEIQLEEERLWDSDDESPGRLSLESRDGFESSHWFLSFDAKWLKPIFTTWRPRPDVQSPTGFESRRVFGR